jgi:hypothetical protein
MCADARIYVSEEDQRRCRRTPADQRAVELPRNRSARRGVGTQLRDSSAEASAISLARACASCGGKGPSLVIRWTLNYISPTQRALRPPREACLAENFSQLVGVVKYNLKRATRLPLVEYANCATNPSPFVCIRVTSGQLHWPVSAFPRHHTPSSNLRGAGL